MPIAYVLLLCSILASLKADVSRRKTNSQWFPREVHDLIVQQVQYMSENDIFWEGEEENTYDYHFDSLIFALRCMDGALSYNFSMNQQPRGGWIVKTEIDLIGDSEKEVVWQVIAPDSGEINYLNNALVYTKSGDFLFHAPPQIIFSEKQGNASRGVVFNRTPMRFGFVIIGADEWVVSSDGVVMRSYDVQDTLNTETEEYSIPGIIQVTERRYSKQGIHTRRESCAPSSDQYVDLRNTISTIEKNTPHERPETLSHVSPLVHAATAKSPIWISGKSPIEELMKKWISENGMYLQNIQHITARQFLELLEQ